MRDRAGRPRSIGLGPLVIGLATVLTAIIAVWSYSRYRGGASLDTVLSVAASMAATVYVVLLAVVAILDALAWSGRNLPFVRILENEPPPVRPDWIVPIAVLIGVAVGKVVWL
jgi:hypothetical protein